MTQQRRPRIYLAGPEVFLPEARAIGVEKCRLAAEAGFEGAFPLDAQLDLARLPPAEQARRISAGERGSHALVRRPHRQPDALPRRVDG